MIFENILLAVQELSTLETLLFMSIGTLAGLVAGAHRQTAAMAGGGKQVLASEPQRAL